MRAIKRAVDPLGSWTPPSPPAIVLDIIDSEYIIQELVDRGLLIYPYFYP